MQKTTITKAALKVLERKGLGDWTLAEVARKADCAKGLIHYHHSTKDKLLEAVAQLLVTSRTESRLIPFRHHGTDALDVLWAALKKAAASGETLAWLSLLASAQPAIRRAVAPPDDYIGRFAEAAARSLGAKHLDDSLVRGLNAALDGLEVALWRGDRETSVQDAYHHLWLKVL